MAKAPWARLTKFMRPIVTDRPEADEKQQAAVREAVENDADESAQLIARSDYDLPGSLTLASLSNSTLKYFPSTFCTLRT